MRVMNQNEEEANPGFLYSPMFSATLLDYFQNPRNAGTLPHPAVTVVVENPACGDLLHLSASMEEGRIVAAGFQVKGCTASIAAGSALTELLLGLTPAEASRIAADAIEKRLDGLPAASRHAATLCADAARALAARLSGAA
jgi:NifU-like protein involved in Fe-S cluster formation